MMFFNQYKLYIYIALFVVYSFGVWHVASRYTSAGYEKEKAVAITKAHQEQDEQQEQANLIGRKAAFAQLQIEQLQHTITERTFHETQKPVYHDCHITDDGLHIIEDAIKNKRKPSQ